MIFKENGPRYDCRPLSQLRNATSQNDSAHEFQSASMWLKGLITLIAFFVVAKNASEVELDAEGQIPSHRKLARHRVTADPVGSR